MVICKLKPGPGSLAAGRKDETNENLSSNEFICSFWNAAGENLKLGPSVAATSQILFYSFVVQITPLS
ncbi:hypothetical protein Hanom_Chr17g01538501 [Helianthus anomalus]